MPSRIFASNSASNSKPSFWPPRFVKDDSTATPSSSSSTYHSEIQGNTRFIRLIYRCYREWAYFIDKYALYVIILSTLLTLIGTVKIVFTPQDNDITGYTPYGARSRDELAIRQEFFEENGPGIALFVLVVPKHGKNLLHADYLQEVSEVDELVANNFTMYNHKNGKFETFSEFCRKFCMINEPFKEFFYGFLRQTELKETGQPLDDMIQLNYPISSILEQRFNIQQNFFGIELTNHTTSSDITNMKRAEMIVLLYKAERLPGWTTPEVKEFEMKVSKFLEKDYKSKHLKVMTMSTSYLETEVVRAGLSMLPFLIVGFVIMVTCSSLTVYFSAFYMKQASVHKLTLAFMACVCPFMASGTALGALFFFGVRFGSILCVSPFLVLAIGVDSAYLMIHAWQRVLKKRREKLIPGDCVAERLAEVLIETGPAILISALTNILADAVGSFTGSPEITLLCIGNMASIFVNFIYQITFFTSIMAIVGRYEIKDEVKSISAPRKLSITIGEVHGVTTIEHNTEPNMRDKFGKFLDGYVKFITNIFVSTVVILLWVSFTVFAVIGITNYEVNLTTKKLFSQDSPLLEIDYYRENIILPFYTISYVIVNEPGDLSNPHRLRRLDSMIHELESLPSAWGPNSTYYFVRDFIKFEKFKEEQLSFGLEDDKGVGKATTEVMQAKKTKIDYNDIPTFVGLAEYAYWDGFLKTKNVSNHTVLEKFFITTAFHGDHLKKWYERAQLLKNVRHVVDRYPEFNASVYQDDGIFMDLIDNMPTDAWQSALATLLCMAAVCMVFMYNTFTVVVASGVIGSILVGTLGTLSWQGVTMDPIMMAALVISIGFSVDIPAHVSYHYHSADHAHPEINTVKKRLKYTFESVGFPAIQASLSTNLCVLSLLFVPLYMAQVFVQIMVLCIMLCIINSLIVIPAVFNIIDRILRLFKKSNEK